MRLKADVSDLELMDVCPDCGARMRADGRSCTLCGYQEDGLRSLELEDASGEPAGSLEAEGPHAASPPGVFCNQCGWQNPAGARYCSQCGSALQDLRAVSAHLPSGMSARGVAPAPSEERHASAESPRDFRTMSLLITAGAVLLVLVLYTVTVVSKDRFVPLPQGPQPSEAAEGIAGAAVVVPAELQDQADAIRADAAALSGADRAARLAEVVNLYLTRGFFHEAAKAQEDVAEVMGTAQAWADAGNLGYRAMQETEGPAKLTYASQAIEAYSRSLELDPNNLDVRTDMATAYLATNDAMEGVNQIRQVLDSDPMHVQANFNYGVMLSMIGRTEQAVEQFERVISLVDANNEIHRQAELALQELRAR